MIFLMAEEGLREEEGKESSLQLANYLGLSWVMWPEGHMISTLIHGVLNDFLVTLSGHPLICPT
jgi:hypothetical protein